jgi:two-component sensor histidine kinase
MVINELCTNAVKYGALSSDAGGVEISSTVDPLRDQFRLRWTERGGPLVNRPKQRSFGTKLIEHSFVRQLGGEAQLSFAPSGVVCVLDIPMTSLKPETRS